MVASEHRFFFSSSVLSPLPPVDWKVNMMTEMIGVRTASVEHEAKLNYFRNINLQCGKNKDIGNPKDDEATTSVPNSFCPAPNLFCSFNSQLIVKEMLGRGSEQ